MKDVCKGCIYLKESTAIEYRPLFANSFRTKQVQVLVRFCLKHCNYVRHIQTMCPDKQTQRLTEYATS